MTVEAPGAGEGWGGGGLGRGRVGKELTTLNANGTCRAKKRRVRHITETHPTVIGVDC